MANWDEKLLYSDCDSDWIYSDEENDPIAPVKGEGKDREKSGGSEMDSIAMTVGEAMNFVAKDTEEDDDSDTSHVEDVEPMPVNDSLNPGQNETLALNGDSGFGSIHDEINESGYEQTKTNGPVITSAKNKGLASNGNEDIQIVEEIVREAVNDANASIKAPVDPPSGQPRVLTNVLFFLYNNVVKKMLRSGKSMHFRQPVDVIKYNIPDYFKFVKNPMDLGTIKQNLENRVYESGSECLKDIDTMFSNSYLYNLKGTQMAEITDSLRKYCDNLLKGMPKEEYPLKTGLHGKGKKTPVKYVSACRNVGLGRPSGGAAEIREPGIGAGADGVRKDESFPRSPDVNPEESSVVTVALAVGKKALAAIPDANGGASRSSSMQNDANCDLHSDSVYSSEVFSHAESDASGTSRRKKKRKAVYGSSAIKKELIDDADMPKRMPRITKSGRKVKLTERFDCNYEGIDPKLKMSDSMKKCNEILKELLSKKCQGFARPFYDAVNPEEFEDYLSVVEQPMDLSEIELRMHTGKYAHPNEFAADIQLMLANCFKYNERKDEPVVKMARKLKKFFEGRMATVLTDKVFEETRESNKNDEVIGAAFSDVSNLTEESELDRIYRELEEEERRIQEKKDLIRRQKEAQAQGHSIAADTPQASTSRQVLQKGKKEKFSVLKEPVTAKEKTGAKVSKAPPAAKLDARKSVRKSTKAGGNQDSKAEKSTGEVDEKSILQNQSFASFSQSMSMILESDDEEDDTEPFTYEEAKKLIADIQELSPEMMARVIRIIKSRESKHSSPTQLEMEVDFGALKPGTLRELRSHVDCCLKKLNKLASSAGKKSIPKVLVQPKRGRGRPPKNVTPGTEPVAKKPKIDHGVMPVATEETKRLSDSSSSSSSSSSESGSSSSSSSSDSSDSEQEIGKRAESKNLDRPKLVVQKAAQNLHRTQQKAAASKVLKNLNLEQKRTSPLKMPENKSVTQTVEITDSLGLSLSESEEDEESGTYNEASKQVTTKGVLLKESDQIDSHDRSPALPSGHVILKTLAITGDESGSLYSGLTDSNLSIIQPDDQNFSAKRGNESVSIKPGFGLSSAFGLKENSNAKSQIPPLNHTEPRAVKKSKDDAFKQYKKTAEVKSIQEKRILQLNDNWLVSGKHADELDLERKQKREAELKKLTEMKKFGIVSVPAGAIGNQIDQLMRQTARVISVPQQKPDKERERMREEARRKREAMAREPDILVQSELLSEFEAEVNHDVDLDLDYDASEFDDLMKN